MDTRAGTILVVDDDEDVLHAARLLLKKHVGSITVEKDPQRIPALIQKESFDVILLDMNFTGDITSGQEGFFWLEKIFAIDPSAVVVLITAFGDVDMAVRAVKAGAVDFILKPWQNQKLLATVSSALKLRQSRREINDLRNRQKLLSADMDQPFSEFIGRSASMQKVFTTIDKVAKTDANVLILGENGTGKELVARALHRRSSRVEEVFISVDMGAVSESLFESELFGHVKGAFTDARGDRPGRFEIASGGTLFLDEIGNLSLALQAKILRVLETRHVTRLGSNKALPIDIRLICASNMPIYDMVGRNEFRQDLLYRINTVEIDLPPLRQRIDDIPPLVDHFMKLYCHKYKKEIKTLSTPTREKLLLYRWPGNVRELRHAVERAVILSESDVLQPEDFFFPGAISMETTPQTTNLEEMEEGLVRQVLERCGGNISRAARELGLTRASLYRRMEKYGL